MTAGPLSKAGYVILGLMLGVTPAFAVDSSPAGFPADASGSANEGTAAKPAPAPAAVSAPVSGAASDVLGISKTTAAPGQTLARENVDKASDLMSPGVLGAVHNGMDMKIVPYEKIPIPKDHQGKPKVANYAYSKRVSYVDRSRTSSSTPTSTTRTTSSGRS